MQVVPMRQELECQRMLALRTGAAPRRARRFKLALRRR
jgi:hypothetical protein